MKHRLTERKGQRQKDRDRERNREGGKVFLLCLKSLSRVSFSAGFTLIEMLVVLVIIGLLIGLVAPRFIGQEEKAKVKATKAQIELLGTALDTLRLDVGRYPTAQEGLEALRRKPGGMDRWDGPYLRKEVPLDPWGKPYVYESPGEHGPYDLLSYGADKVPGGEDKARDITSWE